jgi:transposase-like protein
MLSRVSPTNEQFKQLQKENRRFREELDILKRAAVLLGAGFRISL